VVKEINMKLTQSKLKQLIVEVINEARVYPTPPEGISPKQLDKIHELILSGNEENMNMAQSLIDGFGGDPNYVENYLEYERVGDIEKLGTKAADLEGRGHSDIRDAAFDLATQRANEMYPDLADENYQNFDELDRHTSAIRSHTDRFFNAQDAALAQKKRR
jgi:hypothetical protein